MARQYEVGDAVVTKLTMSKIDGSTPYRIIAQTETVTIMEDLFRPCMIAELHMIDGINLLKTFPINGSEYIDIEFQTPAETEKFTCRMYVYAITDLKIDVENQMQRYTIKCCSQEFLTNVSTVVEKGYDATIDQMVSDILTTNLKTTKLPNSRIYPTQGPQHIVMPQINPFQAIEMLRCRASSAVRQSSSFVFFENKRGFNFLTIEDLFQLGISNNPRKYYRYTALMTTLQSEHAPFHIVDYVVNQQFNIIDAIKTGAYYGYLDSYDWNTKQVSTSIYTGSQFDQFSNLGASGVDSVRSVPARNILQYGQDTGTVRFNTADSSPQKPPTFIEQFLPKKFGFLAPNVTSAYDIYINGDTAVATGDVINVNMVKVDKLTTPATNPEPLTNGNYLITRMKHNLLVSLKYPKYTAIATISKGTYQ